MQRVWAYLMVAALLVGLAAWSWQGALAAPAVQGDLHIVTAPTNGAVVRGQVPILGSAAHAQFQFYKVEFAREPPGGDETWGIVGAIHQQPVVGGQLEVWDTTRIPDGSYALRLRVVKLDGNYDEAFVVQIVVANTQPLLPTETATLSPEQLTPTKTPTPLPPTPTIVIEQPELPTEQAIPGITRTPLPTPVQDAGGFSIDPTPFQSSCLYGAGAILGIFLLFGLLAATRNLIYALLGRRRR
jgi:hypothetical protein